MPNVKTIELTGSETEVRFGKNYPYFWVQNYGGEEIYMSLSPNIVPDADRVIRIPAGSGRSSGDVGQTNVLYFIGNGKIEITPQYNAVCPFFDRSGKGGGDGGFSGDYNDLTNKPNIPIPSEVIDENSTHETVSTSKAVYDLTTQQNTQVLDSANAYTVQKIAELVGTAPDTLDTLEELAAAIQDNQEVIEVLDSAITNKADKSQLEDYATKQELDAKQDKLDRLPKITDNSIDWDTLTQYGSYNIGVPETLNDSATHGLNGVYGYGFLYVTTAERSNAKYQYYINDKTEVYMRQYYSNWKPWTRIDAGAALTANQKAILDSITPEMLEKLKNL